MAIVASLFRVFFGEFFAEAGQNSPMLPSGSSAGGGFSREAHAEVHERTAMSESESTTLSSSELADVVRALSWLADDDRAISEVQRDTILPLMERAAARFGNRVVHMQRPVIGQQFLPLERVRTDASALDLVNPFARVSEPLRRLFLQIQPSLGVTQAERYKMFQEWTSSLGLVDEIVEFRLVTSECMELYVYASAADGVCDVLVGSGAVVADNPYAGMSFVEQRNQVRRLCRFLRLRRHANDRMRRVVLADLPDPLLDRICLELGVDKSDFLGPAGHRAGGEQ